jgi:hypothetical protein
MRKSILEYIRQWAATLHEDLIGLREEVGAMREEMRGLTVLISQMHEDTILLRKELNRLKEFYPVEEEEQEPPWKM